MLQNEFGLQTRPQNYLDPKMILKQFTPNLKINLEPGPDPKRNPNPKMNSYPSLTLKFIPTQHQD